MVVFGEVRGKEIVTEMKGWLCFDMKGYSLTLLEKRKWFCCNETRREDVLLEMSCVEGGRRRAYLCYGRRVFCSGTKRIRWFYD